MIHSSNIASHIIIPPQVTLAHVCAYVSGLGDLKEKAKQEVAAKSQQKLLVETDALLAELIFSKVVNYEPVRKNRYTHTNFSEEKSMDAAWLNLSKDERRRVIQKIAGLLTGEDERVVEKASEGVTGKERG
jgi:hypothetical protein